MARNLTTPQRELLRSPDLHVNMLATFFLDEGTYRFCDDRTGVDLSDGTNTYLGANAFAEASEIRSSSTLAAEPVTLLMDGNRMAQAGVSDPARVLRDILTYMHQQRRVDFAFGFRFSNSTVINLIIPAFAGKINNAKLFDRELNFPEDAAPRTVSYLEIVLDSLAARYNRATNRLRAHHDQLEIDSTDQFYSHTTDVVVNERSLYWGRAAPGRGTLGVGGRSTGGIARGMLVNRE